MLSFKEFQESAKILQFPKPAPMANIKLLKTGLSPGIKHFTVRNLDTGNVHHCFHTEKDGVTDHINLGPINDSKATIMHNGILDHFNSGLKLTKEELQEKYLLPAIKLHMRTVDKQLTNPINAARAAKGKPPLTKKGKVIAHTAKLASVAGGTLTASALTSMSLYKAHPAQAIIPAVASAVGATIGPHALDVIRIRNKLKSRNKI